MKYLVGVDIGGTNIAIGILDEDLNMIIKSSIKTRVEDGFNQIVIRICELIKTLCEDSGIDMANISSIGVGSPGVVDKAQGTVLFAGNLNWKNVPLAEAIKQEIGIPIFVDNDANCAAYGEYKRFYHDKNIDSLVMITIGTGVGGGIILNGKSISGGHGAAGEFGHTVLHSGGKKCTCGRNGCIESYASFSALIAECNSYADANPDSALAALRTEQDKLGGAAIFKLAISGDAATYKIVKQFIVYIAEGVVDIINLLDPQVILIGGGICPDEEFVMPILMEHVLENRFCKLTEPPTISMAHLGNDAGIIGSAALGIKS